MNKVNEINNNVTNSILKRFWSSDFAVIGIFSALAVLLHLIAIEGFGYFRDEFYYISCSDHLDFGYVDQPPLSILLLKLIRLVLGDSLIAIRILPVLAAGLFVFLTGVIARELGGKKFALLLASVAAFAPIGNFFLYNVYSMNFLDHLFWLACIFILLRIIKTGDPKYWLLFGLTAGLGLQNKISVLFLCFGIVVGLVLTKERKHFRSKYLWLGAATAGLLFLPYVLWNMAHGWPHLEFIHNAKAYKMVATSPVEFLKGQILYNNPGTLLIWLAGLWYFFFHREGKKYRLFGWLFLSIYVLLTLQQAKDYYMSGIYPILFAGGAVLIETWLRQKQWTWPKPILIIMILVPTLILIPFALPVLPVDTTAKWMQTVGLTHTSGENHEMGILPQHFADMHGWEAMVEKVAGVYNTLSPEEKKECMIFATNYGITGAINLLGKKYNLPPAFSGHNSHFFWPPKRHTGNVMIIVGLRKKDLENTFKEVIIADRTNCKYCMPYENNKAIHLCRGSNRTLGEIWPNVKHFE
ncbi:MAG: hypothetical protein GTO45_04960 [Candidatus Aminicenantes bacterium]|nr:hypothetical protein [Candidatus Aminicenantes bacterium]NIM78103.1 hypothetical protein [Candidatus Aminicenantes bacterium]NIN17421.1 hypothetical protein [Candidatus Aminicenantes bacterium]NIN41317.1 hypothetical protein [Candidatus Aminicenantes bacterium]NIN84087.1 hypothetical protein [Candidatus Aminicenantes bacterium]